MTSLRHLAAGLVVVLSTTLGTSVPAADPSTVMAKVISAQKREYGEHRDFAGPGYVCGWSFALDLKTGEKATKDDPGIDFETIAVTSPSGDFLLYEGNAPEPAERLVKTGKSFPQVIAIHLPEGSPRSAAPLVEQRLVLGPEQGRICAKASGAS